MAVRLSRPVHSLASDAGGRPRLHPEQPPPLARDCRYREPIATMSWRSWATIPHGPTRLPKRLPVDEGGYAVGQPHITGLRSCPHHCQSARAVGGGGGGEGWAFVLPTGTGGGGGGVPFAPVPYCPLHQTLVAHLSPPHQTFVDLSAPTPNSVGAPLSHTPNFGGAPLPVTTQT
jgi:hypothetical protein